MASSEYTYDAEGEVWPFYVMAVLSFVLLPMTAQWIYSVLQRDLGLNKGITGAIDVTVGDDAEVANVTKYRRKLNRSKVFTKRLLVIIIGWAAVAYIGLYLTKEATTAAVKFDPYALLDVSVTASDREIKSKYRKLSITHHPDKLSGKGLSDKEREAAEQLWVQIGLAYKSLTDPATKENFIKYGHPDGPQEVTHGIALPTFLVEGKYSWVMVIIYFALIGGLLPYIVGLWWNNVKLHTKKGLHVDTAAHFTRRLADRNPAKVVTPDTILEWVVFLQEIQAQFRKKYTPAQLFELVKLHLTRQDAGAKEADKLKLVAMLPNLISGLADIATVFRQPEVVLPAIELQKLLVAAVNFNGKYQELWQLPYVDPKVVEKQPVQKLGKLLTLTPEEQKKVLGIKSDDKLAAAINVAKYIPALRVVLAKFVVPDEPHVTPSSTAFLDIKFLVKGWRLKLCPELPEERLEDEETMEYLRNPLITNDNQPQLPVAYAPYFPLQIFNNWTGLLINQLDNKIVDNSSAFKVTNIDLLNLDLTQEEWIDGKKVVVSSFKVQLPGPTPPLPGTYPFRVVLKNNAYYGCDVDIPVFMDVKPAPIRMDTKKFVTKSKKTRISTGDLDSEEESDSDSESDMSDADANEVLAALKALKGLAEEKAALSKVQEVDSDDDNELVFSDINTDTEDEAEEVKK